MPKTILVILLPFISLVTYSQQKITLQEVSKHVGDTVIVCGKIFGGVFLSSAKNQPTFLNVGAAYPNQQLTVVIWNNTRKLFNYKPEEKLKGKTMCITGKIEMFKNKAQIVITRLDQLQEQ